MGAIICAIFLNGCGGLVPTAMGNGQGGARLTIEQIANIRLDCQQRDYIIAVLERQTTNRDRDPEKLDDDDRKYNAMARSKIWQLRTFCQ